MTALNETEMQVAKAMSGMIPAAGGQAELDENMNPNIVKAAKSNKFRDAFKTVDSLIRKGKDVNAQDGDGNTALHMAARVGNTDLVKRLSGAQGIDKEIKNNKGQTPADVAKDDVTRSQIGVKLGAGDTSKTRMKGDDKVHIGGGEFQRRGDGYQGMESMESDEAIAEAFGRKLAGEAAVNTGFHPPDTANPNYVKPKLKIGDNVCGDGPNDGDINLGVIVGVGNSHMGNNSLPNPDAWTVASIENGQVVQRDMMADMLRKYKGPDELKLKTESAQTEGRTTIMTAEAYKESMKDKALAEDLAAKMAGKPTDKKIAESFGAKLNEFQHTFGNEEPEGWSIEPPNIDDIIQPGDEIAGHSDPKTPLAKVTAVDNYASSSDGGEWIITVDPYPAFDYAVDDLDLGHNNTISLEFADGKFLDDIPFVKFQDTFENISDRLVNDAMGEPVAEAMGDMGTDNEKDTKEKAEILLSTQNMVDQLAKMATDVGKMSTEHLMKLVDEIKIHYDQNMAGNFNRVIGDSLRDLLGNIDNVRNAVSDQVTAIIDPDSAAMLGPMDAGMGGMDAGMDAMGGMDDAGMDGMGEPELDPIAGDELAGGQAPEGRPEKEPADDAELAA